MKKILTTLLLLFSLPSIAQPMPDFPFVIVEEKMEKEVQPDYVDIRFSLLHFNRSSEQAMAELKATGSDIIRILEKHKIPLTQLESNRIEKDVKRARNEQRQNLGILGYEIGQTMKLRLNNLELYSPFINDLLSVDGVNGIHSWFESSRADAIKIDMIAELGKQSRQQADTLAASQAKTIKGVYGITTQDYHQFHNYAMSMEISAPMDSGHYRDGLTMMVPGHITLHQHLTTVFELN